MPKGFQETEFQVPFTALQDKGYIVDIAGLVPGDAIGHQGMRVEPSYLLSDMKPQDFDSYEAIIIPGGPGSVEYVWNNPLLQSVVTQFHHNKKIVAVICNACIVPVQANILNGSIATVYPTSKGKSIFAEHGVEFSPQGCISDPKKRIITAQSPRYAKAFALAIVAMLED
jgi:protease I